MTDKTDDLTHLERIARAFERRDRDWYVLGPPWVGFTSDFTILRGHPDPHVGEAILYTASIEEADEDEDHYRQEALAKWLELADPQTVLDLIERVRAAEGALIPFVARFEKERTKYANRYETTELGYRYFDKMPDSWPMPDKPDYEMGMFREARVVLRRAAALHTEGGEWATLQAKEAQEDE
ncbi:MAG: hypothetical protein AAFZ74_01935 [Pseudomonadota bacterium]